MNKQPYALRLADDLRAAPERTRTSFEAADELRRLHEQNDRFADGILSMGRRIAALEAVNAELLDALKAADWYIGQLEPFVYGADDNGVHEEHAKVRAAIAKATGAQL